MSIWFIPDMLVTSDETDAKCGTLVGKAFDTSMFNKLREEGREDGATFKQLLSCIPGSESVSLDPSLLFGNLMKLGTETVALPNFHLTIGQAIGFAALSVIKGKKAAAAVKSDPEADKKAADAALVAAAAIKLREESEKKAADARAAALAEKERKAALSKETYPDAIQNMHLNCDTTILTKEASDIRPYLNPIYVDENTIFHGFAGCLNLNISDLTFGRAWQAVGRYSYDNNLELTGGQITTIVMNSVNNGTLTDNTQVIEGKLVYPFTASVGGRRTRHKKRSRKSKKLTRRRA